MKLARVSGRYTGTQHTDPSPDAAGRPAVVFVWPIILLLTFLILRYPLSTRPLQLAATLVTMGGCSRRGSPAPWQRAQTLDKDLWGQIFFAQLLYGGGREVIEGDET